MTLNRPLARANPRGLTWPASGHRFGGDGSSNYFSDDAKQNRYFTDDALANPLLLSGGNQASIDGDFDDSVVNELLSYVTDGTTSTPTVRLIPRRTINGSFIPDPGQWGIWMARLNNMSGKTPEIRVPTKGNYFGFLSNNSWWSYDRTTWTRFDNSTSVSGTFIFDNNAAFTEDTVYVAYLPMFSNPQIKQWLTDNESTGYLHEPVAAVSFGGEDYQIGETNLGYPIYAVRITDEGAAPTLGAEKKIAVITGGSHPSELPGSWNAKGLADFLLSADAAAINLRKEFEFWICFCTTPESRAKGMLRYTFDEGVDPNRNIPGSGSGHETEIVTDAMQAEYGVNGPIDVGVDFHGGIITLYFGFFQDNEPEATDFFTTLDGYVPTSLSDSGSFLDETMAGFFGVEMGAQYYASLEMGMTAINTIAEMENYGVYVAKTINDLEGGADATPNTFDFTDDVNVAISTLTESDIVQVLGMNSGTAISIAGSGSPEYRICSDGACSTVAHTWTTSPGTIDPGEYVQVRLTSSASNSTANTATLTVGTLDVTYAVTTISAGFAPTDIAGCQLWLDASDTATITDAGSGAVSQWDDKSGNGNDFTQSTSGARPTTGIRTQNSLNVLDFDGGDWMTSGLEALGSTGLHAAAGQAYTVFVVLDHDSGSGYFFSRASATAGNRGFGILTDATTLQLISRGSANQTLKASWSGAGTPPSIATVRWSGTALQSEYNADGLATESAGTAAEDVGEKIAIGARTTASTPAIFLNGGIMEIIVYDVSLSDTDKDTVRDYLNAKWNIY